MLSQHHRMAEVYEAYEVHLRYGLCSCARPRSGSGATFFRRCSHVSVALHANSIATQATSLLLWQDFHLQETEQLSNHSEWNLFGRPQVPRLRLRPAPRAGVRGTGPAALRSPHAGACRRRFCPQILASATGLQRKPAVLWRDTLHRFQRAFRKPQCCAIQHAPASAPVCPCRPRRSNRETDHWLTGRQIPQLRISAQISDNHRSIQRHDTSPLCAVLSTLGFFFTSQLLPDDRGSNHFRAVEPYISFSSDAPYSASR